MRFYVAIAVIAILLVSSTAIFVYEKAGISTVSTSLKPGLSFAGRGFGSISTTSGSEIGGEFTVDSGSAAQVKAFLTDESFYTAAQLQHNSSVEPDFLRNITSMTINSGGGAYNVTQSPYIDSRGDTSFTNGTGSPLMNLPQGPTSMVYALSIPSGTPVGQYLIDIDVVAYSSTNLETGILTYTLTVNIT